MAEAVKVIVRCRPLNDREKKLNCKNIVDMIDDMGKCSIRKPGSTDQVPKEFTFDGAYYVNSTTEQIYNDIAYPLVEGVVEGYNGTVFAYGQTGCGKSFSMQGIEDPATQRGIIPRAFQHIFESIETAENTKYLVHASYLEIYNEDVRDLLSKNIKEKLELKEHPDKGVYVKDLSMQRVGNVLECEHVMSMGWQNRTVGATLMNADSSRSHSIFTIYLEACDTGIDGGDHIRAGKLNLVDLAGSERQSKTGATGDRLKEATKINLSLSALGNVISALVDGKSKHIPYRDSKLTRLLQDSLGGNTKTLMVACLSPADNNYDETLSTLRYANRAKNIKNKPHINEDPKDALLREYQEEIKKLRGLLAGQLGPDGIKALLEGQSPFQQRSKSETQEETDETGNADLESDSMRKEYEEKITELKQRYEAEQMSNAKLQEDMNKLKTQYDQHISQAGLAVQNTLTMDRLSQELSHISPYPPDDDSSTSDDCSSSVTGDSVSPSFRSSDVGGLELDHVTEGDQSQDTDLKVYRQSANFMLKLSELIYNHALEMSVRRSLHDRISDVMGGAIADGGDFPMPLTSSTASDVGFYESSFESGETTSETVSLQQQPEHQVAQYIGSKPSNEEVPNNALLEEDEKTNEDDVMKQHEEALKRLQMLQQNMVGGERSRDEEAKLRRQSRRKHVDERKRRLAQATLRDDDETILDVYDSIHDDVKGRDKIITKQKKKLEGLKMEVEDLNYEFERDRSEYLATIRRQERELELLNGILGKLQPTIRRDCNYGNLDRIKSETKFDEDEQRWILPDLVIVKTSLPSAGPQNGVRGGYSDRVGYSPPQSTSSTESYSQRSDEDKYLAKLNNSRNEQLASSYFMPKRQVKQIISSSHSDGTLRSRFHSNSPSGGMSSSSSNGFSQNGDRYSPVGGSHHHPLSATNVPTLPPGASYTGLDDLVRRPHKLEAIPSLSSKSKKPKKKKSSSGTMDLY